MNKIEELVAMGIRPETAENIVNDLGDEGRCEKVAVPCEIYSRVVGYF